jgi:hypothetical protein
VGDFSGDGDPDLAVASDSSAAIAVMEGGAGGSFGSPTTVFFSPGTFPYSIAVGDSTPTRTPTSRPPIRAAPSPCT